MIYHERFDRDLGGCYETNVWLLRQSESPNVFINYELFRSSYVQILSRPAVLHDFPEFSDDYFGRGFPDLPEERGIVR